MEMQSLQEINRRIKRDVLNASFEAKACHIGSALSATDILVPLLYFAMKPKDIFIFGKASGVAAYYAILADQGVFKREKLVDYIRDYPLPSTEVPGVFHSFGAVGHALNVAAGAALGDPDTLYWVLLSDGDLMEGASYEAALFIRQHNIQNLNVIVDDNGLVACGRADDILKIDYDFYERNIPNFLREQTTKGSGVDFMEDNYEWHYKNLDQDLLTKALRQIHGQ